MMTDFLFYFVCPLVWFCVCNMQHCLDLLTNTISSVYCPTLTGRWEANDSHIPPHACTHNGRIFHGLAELNRRARALGDGSPTDGDEMTDLPTLTTDTHGHTPTTLKRHRKRERGGKALTFGF